MSKYENFQTDIGDIPSLTSKIKDIYQTEFNEQFENILLKKEGDFMRYLSQRAKFQIEELYTDEAFENIKLITIIKNCERELYEKDFQPALTILRTKLSEYNKSDNKQPNQDFIFRKHCNYQEEIPLHSCEQDNNNFICIFDIDDPDIIKYAICTKCQKAYQASFIHIYCNFCSISYYSCIETDQSEIKKNIQPATWEKYHCNMIINEQMKCLNCKEGLSFHIKDTMLICLHCNFESEPSDIVWKCVKCLKEFYSNAKIYNPNEYKPINLAVKESLFNRKLAMPKQIACSHKCKSFTHNKDCNGIVYNAQFNNREMVMCSKCNSMTKYDKFIWTCSECKARFRNDSRILSKPTFTEEPKSIVKAIQKSFAKDGEDIEKSQSLGMKRKYLRSSTSVIPKNSITKLDKDEIEETKDSITKEESSSTQQNLIKLPMFKLEDYEILSHISLAKNTKVYAIKDITQNTFLALKKHCYKYPDQINSFAQQYALQYSLQTNPNIVNIYGINVDEEKKELNIIEEIGIGDWENEIVSMKKLKQKYTEEELVNILCQLTNALEFLQKNEYVHWYISPRNIITFKDNIYKLANFSYIKSITSLDIDQNENVFISPNLNRIYNERKGKNVHLVKSDVYSLGLCMIEAMTQDPVSKIFNDFVNIDNKENTEDIMKRFETMLQERSDKKIISQNFITLLLKMISIDEKERMDFITLRQTINDSWMQ